MKKIIALAVATAISAPAMADLTISGSVAAGWSGSSEAYSTDGDAVRLANCLANEFSGSTPTDKELAAAVAAKTATTAAGACNALAGATSGKGDQGFGIDTAELVISGSETLESGLTVAGYMTAGNLQRSGGFSGGNAELSLAGDFGKFAITNVKAGAYTESYGPADNFVGEFGTEAVVDLISYTTPALMDGMVTLSVDASDAGEIGTADSDYDPQFTAKIKAGAFSGRVAYKVVDNGENRVRVGGTFDLGAVKVAAAYQDQDKVYTYTSGGIVVPMGATTLGLSMAQKETATAEYEGMSVGVEHALSSNVSVSAKVNKYDSSNTGETEHAGNVLVTLAF